MEKEFAPYKLAVKLNVLGFDEPCFGRYYYKKLYPMLNPQSEETELVFEFGKYIRQTEVTLLAPLYQQAFRWVMQFPQIKKYRYNVALYSDGTYSLKEGKDAIYEYLSAESCLEKLIEIVETKSE